MHKEGVPRRFLAATRRALIAPPRYNSHERDCATDWLCARPQVYIHAHDHITQDVPRSRMSCARQGQRTASVAQHAVYRNDQPQRVQRGRKEERDGSQRHLVPDNGRIAHWCSKRHLHHYTAGRQSQSLLPRRTPQRCSERPPNRSALAWKSTDAYSCLHFTLPCICLARFLSTAA